MTVERVGFIRPLQRPFVTGLILAALLDAPAHAQWLTVTSKPDPNRVEPGVSTLTLKATVPDALTLKAMLQDSLGGKLSKCWLMACFDMKEPDGGTGCHIYYSPEKPADPGTVLSWDFPVPAETISGQCHALAVFEGEPVEGGLAELEGHCVDVSPPKLHRGSGPVGEAHPGLVISPPPVEKPPKEEPRPDERQVASGAQTRRQSGVRLERWVLSDGRLLVLKDSRLTLFATTGHFIRSYPPGSRVVVSESGEVSVRESLGTLRK